MQESWPKVAVTVVVMPLALLFFGTIFIPGIVAESNQAEALRVARLKKAFDIGEHNKEFNSRINVLKTRMHSFNEQNIRARFSSAHLREAQREFRQKHTDDYLELDRMAWWWYWDLEREAEIYDLLAPEELKSLHDASEKYGANVVLTVATITPLWQYLSSSEYNLSAENQKRVGSVESEMMKKLQDLSDERTQLAKVMASSFAQSRHKPKD